MWVVVVGAWQEEDSEEYGSPMVLATAIADVIKQRTESHLRKVQAAVSSKPIVMRAEYAHCPNLTIIDTPGFVLKVGRGELETSHISTPGEVGAELPGRGMGLEVGGASGPPCRGDSLEAGGEQ